MTRRFWRRRNVVLLLVAVLVVAGVAWYLFSPLLFDVVVDEPFPGTTE